MSPALRPLDTNLEKQMSGVMKTLPVIPTLILTAIAVLGVGVLVALSSWAIL